MLINAQMNPALARGARGYIMIEALITVVILAVGLLGLAGLQSKMAVVEMESYQRGQALILLEDMAARINANRTNAISYTTGGTPLGTGDTTNCSAPSFGVMLDKCQWSGLLKGTAETQGAGGANIGAMIGARGCVDEEVVGATPRTLRIVVAWQGLYPTWVPALMCGADSAYGDTATITGYRRAISKTVTIATLTPP